MLKQAQPWAAVKQCWIILGAIAQAMGAGVKVSGVTLALCCLHLGVTAAVKDGLEEVILGMADEEWSSAFMDLVAGQTYEKLKIELKRDPVLTFRWCQANGLVADTCPECKLTLDVGDSTKAGQQIRCMQCHKPVAALQGTWFHNIDIDPWKAICVMYHWAVGNSHRGAAHQLAMDEDTIKHWYRRCQEAAEFNLRLCTNATTDEEQEETSHGKRLRPLARNHYEDDHIACYCPKYRIGGKGRIVEVDVLERGHLLQEKCVLAGIERGGWRAFAIPVPDTGDSKALKAVLSAKLFPGTIVRDVEKVAVPARELKHVRAFLRDMVENMKQPATEDMIPVYSSQWMWRKVNESYRGDVFTQMVEHVSKAFPFTPDGKFPEKPHDAIFFKDPFQEEAQKEEVCTQLILLPNKPPVVQKFLIDKSVAEKKPEKPAPAPKKPSKIPPRKPTKRPARRRSFIRVAPRPQLVRTPPPGVGSPRAYSAY
ncbi:unnamed protein product [Notodromas monacha]|uniref:Uncharacterized protein n=1 Tax=Notodromas monacha TaxID=399045 RepID=A0A7R9BEN9_9CRUS|nr:unnamed protein product [Notodromas monacha]CAG0912415.1 unnamed protein product [Notodromas monacha]